MVASSLDDEFLTLVCTSPDPIETETEQAETLISTADIHTWDSSAILRYQTLQIQAHRRTLLQHSSYFHSLLSGNFSESNLQCVPISWNLESVLNVLKVIYGCRVGFTSSNFLPLFEAALYFGVETLLVMCKTWVREAAYSEGIILQLDDLIHIWNFGLAHAIDFFPDLCASYLARNFMWATSCNSFGDVPHDLLLLCIQHPNLTVDSERFLCDALLIWTKTNAQRTEPLSKLQDDCTGILKQIRLSLLPLWFTAGKRRSDYFSELADESMRGIFELIKIPPRKSINALGDGDLNHLRIRLTEYSKKVNLSGCPQITQALLLLSLLPSSYSTDSKLRKSCKHSVVDIHQHSRDKSGTAQGPLHILSFDAVVEVDISRCPSLHLEAAMECFSKSFPSLRKLKAAYLLNIKTTTLHKLVRKCPLLTEVDFTVDINPLIPSQISVISSTDSRAQMLSSKPFVSGNNSLSMAFYSKPSLSNLTNLTLDGRSDFYDSDLEHITRFCLSLQYISLKGCVSVTDVGISHVISTCVKLHSVLVCDTSFGVTSVLALCSAVQRCGATTAASSGEKCSDTLAHKLQKLHMGGCKAVDQKSLQNLLSQTQMLRSLRLRGTYLVDAALYSFSGSSLETLDVSDTMISGAALAHTVHHNPALKCLNVRDCKKLFQLERGSDELQISSPHARLDICAEIAQRCILEELAFGWGFSYSTLDVLKPATMTLRVLTVGLGASLGEDALKVLPTTCPMLEEIVLYFQVISNSIVTNILFFLKRLQSLALCYCIGDISISSLKLSMPNLRKLRLLRVASSMTNDDLVTLSQNCANLVELSLVGCRLLSSDSLHIISHGWLGLITLHLEDCGKVTSNGISSLFHCRALEDLLLRHNGPGIHKNFILDAASKMPVLRQVSLDLCDACDGGFEIPDYADRYFLSTVKIARCKFQRRFSISEPQEVCRSRMHKDTLVMVWNSRCLNTSVIKERI